jgi:hypothetical protein
MPRFPHKGLWEHDSDLKNKLVPVVCQSAILARWVIPGMDVDVVALTNQELSKGVSGSSFAWSSNAGSPIHCECYQTSIGPARLGANLGRVMDLDRVLTGLRTRPRDHDTRSIVTKEGAGVELTVRTDR